MSYTKIRELDVLRNAAWESAKAILDVAEHENRDLTAAEEQSYQRAVQDLDAVDQRKKRLVDVEQRQREAEESLAALREQVPIPGRGAGDPDVDAAFRSAGLNNSRQPIIVGPRDRRSGFQPGLERRDLVTTSGTGMVGTSFYERLVVHAVESSAVMSAGATMVQSETGEPLKVPRTSAHSTAAIVAEGGTIGESDPTLGVASLGGFKYGFLVQCSFELLRDASFDVVGYLAEQAGVAIGNAFGAHAINGTGTGQPRGVLLDGTLGVTGPTGTATTLGTQATAGQGGDLLADLLASVAEPYVRARACAWLMRGASLNQVRKLKTSQGEYAFTLDAPAGSGASGSIFGRPVFVDPYVPAMAANAKSIILADWSRVFVRQVGPVRFERSDEFAFGNDLATFRGLITLDSALVDTTGALKWFANSAT